jgi:O-antigen ligase
MDVDPAIKGLWDTHSLYLNVIAETGYPGLFLYVVYLCMVFIPVDRIRRRCKVVLPNEARQLLILEAGLIGFMTGCIFGSLAYLPHLHLHLVLMYALAKVYERELLGAEAPSHIAPHVFGRRTTPRRAPTRQFA